jgi:hypothetical protein
MNIGTSLIVTLALKNQMIKWWHNTLHSSCLNATYRSCKCFSPHLFISWVLSLSYLKLQVIFYLCHVMKIKKARYFHFHIYNKSIFVAYQCWNSICVGIISKGQIFDVCISILKELKKFTLPFWRAIFFLAFFWK